MTEHIVKVLRVGFITHDTKSLIFEKPKGYKFKPGQATSVAIKKTKELQKRPITFSSIPDEPILEMIIKKYFGGETEKIHRINAGEELVINDPFGTIEYKGEGYFIAGGAGVTPFVSIFRELYKEGKVGANKLIFSNKESRDIILEKELENILGENLIINLTKEKKVGYNYGRINEKYLKKYIEDFSKKFYVCGPADFVREVKEILIKLGAKVSSITVEGGL